MKLPWSGPIETKIISNTNPIFFSQHMEYGLNIGLWIDKGMYLSGSLQVNRATRLFDIEKSWNGRENNLKNITINWLRHIITNIPNVHLNPNSDVNYRIMVWSSENWPFERYWKRSTLWYPIPRLSMIYLFHSSAKQKQMVLQSMIFAPDWSMVNGTLNKRHSHKWWFRSGKGMNRF